jgi:hypothetical protein
MIVLEIFLCLFVSLLGLAVIYPSLSNPAHFMPPAPSSKWHHRLTEQFLLSVFPGKRLRICELGSAWGGTLPLLAKHKSWNCVGVEVNWFLHRFCRARWSSTPIRFQHDNAFDVDLSDFDVIIGYMDFNFNRRFESHLAKHPEWRGKTLITYQFSMPGWTSVREEATRLNRWYAYTI